MQNDRVPAEPAAWQPVGTVIPVAIAAYHKVNGLGVRDTHLAIIRQLAFQAIIARGVGMIRDLRPGATRKDDTAIKTGSNVPEEFWQNWAATPAADRTADWLTGEFSFMLRTGETPSASISGRVTITHLSGPGVDALMSGPPNDTDLLAPNAGRAGKYKGGDADRDQQILAKMVAMKGKTGLHGRTIASMLPKLRGYEDVAVTYARALIGGEFKRGSGERVRA